MIDRRFIRRIRFRRDVPLRDRYVWDLPAIQNTREVELSDTVTFFVGENGSGKSTLLEAVAVNWGFNAEGGSVDFNFSTAETHADFYKGIALEKSALLPEDGYFLRAESFYNVASQVEKLGLNLNGYGGKSLHAQSHGESFLSLALSRFRGRGLYILDEPEAALSAARQLSLLYRLHELDAERLTGADCHPFADSDRLSGRTDLRVFRRGYPPLRLSGNRQLPGYPELFGKS